MGETLRKRCTTSNHAPPLNQSSQPHLNPSFLHYLLVGLARLETRILLSCLFAFLCFFLLNSPRRPSSVERLPARQNITSMARVYADVNENMPRSYWDYDSVNIQWGVLENYEVVRKIGS